MNIGFLVRSFQPSQLMYTMIRNINKYIVSSADTPVIGFFDQPYPLQLVPQFPIMQSHEALYFNGLLIATDLKTAHKMVNCNGTKYKLFYVWDLEWLYNKNQNFVEFSQFYQNHNIELIARSEQHAKAIEDTWNRSVIEVVEDFNMTQLLKVVKKYGTDTRISG